jgi:hypothetical protein
VWHGERAGGFARCSLPPPHQVRRSAIRREERVHGGREERER